MKVPANYVHYLMVNVANLYYLGITFIDLCAGLSLLCVLQGMYWLGISLHKG